MSIVVTISTSGRLPFRNGMRRKVRSTHLPHHRRLGVDNVPAEETDLLRSKMSGMLPAVQKGEFKHKRKRAHAAPFRIRQLLGSYLPLCWKRLFTSAQFTTFHHS